jgi:nicotinate-nucleotide adenylyltransferase
MGVSVGVFGGAFDPPHLGHLALARGALDRFGLERLLVRVVADPGHKAVDTPADIRLGLTELAFDGMPGVEVALDPHARTVDSLRALGLDDPLFLIGADEFAGFLSWKDPDGVLELARLGVGTRPGIPHDALDDVLERLAQPHRVTFFEIEPHAISSSTIRQLIADGVPLDLLVPPAVAGEVLRLGLYREAPETAAHETAE